MLFSQIVKSNEDSHIQLVSRVFPITVNNVLDIRLADFWTNQVKSSQIQVHAALPTSLP